tara:strand:- start:272 stop:502 length:231 start_codon:yes stop_codon:yes gene_type:complete
LTLQRIISENYTVESFFVANVFDTLCPLDEGLVGAYLDASPLPNRGKNEKLRNTLKVKIVKKRQRKPTSAKFSRGK